MMKPTQNDHLMLLWQIRARHLNRAKVFVAAAAK